MKYYMMFFSRYILGIIIHRFKRVSIVFLWSNRMMFMIEESIPKCQAKLIALFFLRVGVFTRVTPT